MQTIRPLHPDFVNTLFYAIYTARTSSNHKPTYIARDIKGVWRGYDSEPTLDQYKGLWESRGEEVDLYIPTGNVNYLPIRFAFDDIHAKGVFGFIEYMFDVEIEVANNKAKLISATPFVDKTDATFDGFGNDELKKELEASQANNGRMFIDVEPVIEDVVEDNLLQLLKDIDFNKPFTNYREAQEYILTNLALLDEHFPLFDIAVSIKKLPSFRADGLFDFNAMNSHIALLSESLKRAFEILEAPTLPDGYQESKCNSKVPANVLELVVPVESIVDKVEPVSESNEWIDEGPAPKVDHEPEFDFDKLYNRTKEERVSEILATRRELMISNYKAAILETFMSEIRAGVILEEDVDTLILKTQEVAPHFEFSRESHSQIYRDVNGLWWIETEHSRSCIWFDPMSSLCASNDSKYIKAK